MGFRFPFPFGHPAPRDDADPYGNQLRVEPLDPPLYPPAAVWICPECDDVYDRPTPDGNCPNLGHAVVALNFRSVRSLEPDKAKAR